MSKTGRYAHFGSKQEPHLATVAEAGRILAEEAARAARAGLAQLRTVCEAHFDYPSAAPSRRLLLRCRGTGDDHPPGRKEQVAALQAGFAPLARGLRWPPSSSSTSFPPARTRQVGLRAARDHAGR